MAYEYEKNVVAEIKELGARYKAPSFYAMADEVEDVYAKAKAFDEIKKLRNSYYTYSKRDNGGLVALLDAKPFGREVSHFINKKEYMEDK
ncbi:hypothetical protein FPV13_08960 [Mammaliicoccus sciuri]|uniref:hypothetical protein n=1 Tax=Mammaliicoccus sciuri TaxID=1296 RepID=UPI0011879CBB|nr:hypothetical protein [Mammaliicoccus sciuri]QDR65004.1 hypothetical protein FPV13_08960 [Mammaliicoccus sciuri]